ncbi:hypothetical protein EVAR_99930_1 [Eumeta japonica]|uniref:Uncharacterized protein n=1 Tax=Eumeta variegata TaxID=151549 RepID=A0A4C1Z2K4_EUMVA|nr:hypothetical protein EVAR_99930_1 [Eumeta japonica]
MRNRRNRRRSPEASTKRGDCRRRVRHRRAPTTGRRALIRRKLDNTDNKVELEDSRQRAHKENSESHGRIRAFLGALGRAEKACRGQNTRREQNPKRGDRSTGSNSCKAITRPILEGILSVYSAYLSNPENPQTTCEGILRLCQNKSEARQTAALENAEAAIYDDFQAILIGKMSIIHMATYSATNGLTALDEEQTDRTEKSKYFTLSYDSIVVIIRCTSVTLEERILEIAKTVTKRKGSGDARED